ncbi:MAG: hypothetical protein WC799_12650 [Desulfobacteraceae bacterium]|jgi:hypothetical protein
MGYKQGYRPSFVVGDSPPYEFYAEFPTFYDAINIEHRIIAAPPLRINPATKYINVYHTKAMGYALAPPILHTESGFSIIPWFAVRILSFPGFSWERIPGRLRLQSNMTFEGCFQINRKA